MKPATKGSLDRTAEPKVSGATRICTGRDPGLKGCGDGAEKPKALDTRQLCAAALHIGPRQPAWMRCAEGPQPGRGCSRAMGITTHACISAGGTPRQSRWETPTQGCSAAPIATLPETARRVRRCEPMGHTRRRRRGVAARTETVSPLLASGTSCPSTASSDILPEARSVPQIPSWAKRTFKSATERTGAARRAGSH